jgi:hypothetical protein
MEIYWTCISYENLSDIREMRTGKFGDEQRQYFLNRQIDWQLIMEIRSICSFSSNHAYILRWWLFILFYYLFVASHNLAKMEI